MDPDKTLAAVAKALGLEEGASREQLVKALDALAALKEAKDGEGDAPEPEAAPEEPEAPAEASREDADAVAATDAPEGDVVEASVDAEEADAVELMDEVAEHDPVAGEMSTLVSALCEATGMDEASCLAALRERLDDVAALLTGQPADGMPADEAEHGMSRAALEASRANTKAAQAKLTKANAEIAKLTARLDDLEAERRKDRVEAAIASGHITRASAKPYFALARKGGQDFDDLMAEAAESPEVPTGTVAAGKGSDTAAADNVTPEASQHPEVLKLTSWLRNAKLENTARGKAQIERLVKRIEAGDYGRA